MKQVMVCDGSKMFRQFIKEKLESEKIGVDLADSQRDGFLLLVNHLPELVIFDFDGDNKKLLDFLEKKQTNPNTMKIPVILMGPPAPAESLSQFAKYNVLKYFTKPIKFDILFDIISEILKMPMPIDSTPCVLDIHVNDKIIFIELAQGLNREKLGFLKYRLTEIIDENEIIRPKVIVMLTGLELSFVDGSNLELLFDNILADKRIKPECVKILSLDQFTADLVDGHPEYDGFEVVKDLSKVLSSLIENQSGSVEETITDKILASNSNFNVGTVETRFTDQSNGENSEGSVIDIAPSPSSQPAQSAGAKTGLKIAIVDDDPKVCAILKATFEKIKAQCDVFTNGADFFKALATKQYTALSLDMFMPNISGLMILQQLKAKNINIPTVVYSNVAQKETIAKAMQLGAKAYLTKPQYPPLAVAQKIIEVLKK